MVYTMHFFGMNAGCHKFPFQNLPTKSDEKTVDAKLDRNEEK